MSNTALADSFTYGKLFLIFSPIFKNSSLVGPNSSSKVSPISSNLFLALSNTIPKPELVSPKSSPFKNPSTLSLLNKYPIVNNPGIMISGASLPIKPNPPPPAAIDNNEPNSGFPPDNKVAIPCLYPPIALPIPPKRPPTPPTIPLKSFNNGFSFFSPSCFLPRPNNEPIPARNPPPIKKLRNFLVSSFSLRSSSTSLLVSPSVILTSGLPLRYSYSLPDVSLNLLPSLVSLLLLAAFIAGFEFFDLFLNEATVLPLASNTSSTVTDSTLDFVLLSTGGGSKGIVFGLNPIRRVAFIAGFEGLGFAFGVPVVFEAKLDIGFPFASNISSATTDSTGALSKGTGLGLIPALAAFFAAFLASNSFIKVSIPLAIFSTKSLIEPTFSFVSPSRGS